MSEQYDSLEQKARRVDIALRYTDGDMTQAKEMAAGQFLDIRALKGKFILEGSRESGLFIVFFNVAHDFIPSAEAIMSANNSLFERTKVFDGWTALFKDMMDAKKTEDNIPTDNLHQYLIDTFLDYDLFTYVNDRNLDQLTDKIREILKKRFGRKVQVQIDQDETSSVELELSGIFAEKEETKEEPAQAQEPIDPSEDPFTRRTRQIESEAGYIVEGSSVVSPVKGKFLNDIIIGDRIKVLLPGKDQVTSKILSVLNARDDEGNIKPVKGRIKEMVPMDKGGYVIYAVVAKGVYAKIIEEENVKILLDAPKKMNIEEEAKKGKDYSTIATIGFLVFLILVAGSIVIFLL